MKKLLTLFTLLLTVCSGAWAQYPTYSLIDGGAINTAHFLTTGSLNDGSNNSTYSKYVKLSGNVTGTTSLASSANFIAYDVKTTKTVFTVYVYNKNSSAKNLHIHDVKELLTEGKATATMTTKSIASKSKDADPESYTTNNTGKATIYFTSAGASDAEFYQIIASEEGDPIDNATAGYVGYSLNLNRGRIATKAAETPSYDGIEFCTSSDYKPTNNTELKLKTFGTHYVKFTTHERCALFLTRTSNIAYTLGSAKNVAGATQYGPTAGTDKIVLDGNTTYFINPVSGNTSDFKITNIAFAPVYAINFAAGTGGSGTMTTLYNYEGGKVTVPACTFTAPDGQVFDHWNVAGIDGKTEADPDEELTMPDNAITLTAVWRTPAVKYHVTYELNGGTGTNPTETDKEEGDKFTLHDGVTDITAPDGKKFVAWNDGTNNYDGGALYTMPGENVTLTAQWANKYTITKLSTTHGTIAVSATEAAAGEEITLTATPDFKYVLGSWIVYKTGDATNTTYVDANNKFIMPAYDVTVDATFIADPRKQVLYVTSDGSVNENDKLYAALSEDYTVTKAAYNADKDVTDFDLVVLHESIGGGNYNKGLVKNAKGANVPLLNTKSYFYTSGRWGWGTPNAGKSVAGATLNSAYTNIASHPIFDDVTISEGFVTLFSSAKAKAMQPVTDLVSGKEGYALAITPNADSGNGVAIHELTPAQRGVATAKYLMISIGNENGCFEILTENGQKLLKNAAAYLLSNDQWVPTVPVTVTSAEWATATTPNWPVEFDENAKVYVVASAEGSIKLTQIAEAPANTPIIVNAAAGSYTMTPKASAAAIETNLLKSKTANDETAAVGDYALGTWLDGSNTVVGFGKLNAAGVVNMTDDKAFIPATALANAVDFLPFVIGDEESETTSIKAVETAEVSGTVYNLAGQKVGKDYKGIVIVNGKKFVRK